MFIAGGPPLWMDRNSMVVGFCFFSAWYLITIKQVEIEIATVNSYPFKTVASLIYTQNNRLL
jgi:hypothetical protein